jgi:cell division protein FtsB
VNLTLTSRKVSLLVALGVVIGILSLGVFPLREYIDQRSALSDTRGQLEEVEAQNAAFELRIQALASDETIEYLARSEYNLVYSDEEAYTILPLPDFQAPVPEPWPFAS